MCGVLGIYGHGYIAQDIYDGLITLQHRGQDATGMVTFDTQFHLRKELGLVKDVFHTRHMKSLTGYVGIGHTRYSTVGNGSPNDAQPFIGPAPFGVALAHNGNLFNAYELKERIYKDDHRLVNSNCDAEVLLNIFTKALTKQNPNEIKPEHIWKSIKSVYDRAKGAYSVVSYIAKQGMIAFRDPHGIRPLVFGKRENGLKTDYIFSSESVTLDILGFELIGDVGPGEAIFIDEKTRTVHRKSLNPKPHIPCIFEYIYFARPDSMLNNISVYKSRVRMGESLAKRIEKMKLDIDVVMPVPDSSRTAAIAMSHKLNIPYSEGLVKNRYIGRTFIMPGQKIRKKSIRYKLNPMKLEMEGKKILLVDDSIVRGNTSRAIVQMIKAQGAKKVYFVSYSPPVMHPCLFGIDIPTREELIAGSNSIEEIRKYIGADKLIYQEVTDMFKSCKKGYPKTKDFCMACFDGKYKTGDIDKDTIDNNASSRLTDKACGRLDDIEEEPSEPQLDLDI